MDIVQIIQNVGFPVAACVGLYLLMDRQRVSHEEESKLMRDMIAKNTEALVSLRVLFEVARDSQE